MTAPVAVEVAERCTKDWTSRRIARKILRNFSMIPARRPSKMARLRGAFKRFRPSDLGTTEHCGLHQGQEQDRRALPGDSPEPPRSPKPPEAPGAGRRSRLLGALARLRQGGAAAAGLSSVHVQLTPQGENICFEVISLCAGHSLCEDPINITLKLSRREHPAR